MTREDEKKPSLTSTRAETPVAKTTAAAQGIDAHRRDAGITQVIPANHPWSNLWKIWAGVALVGAVLSFVGFGSDPKRFAFSYLAAFAWGLTLALGGLFFVLLQHITGAGWSVVIRRGAEQLMGTLPVFALLFIPIFLFRDSLYPWTSHEIHEKAVSAKLGYLNVPFWGIRAVIYFAIWTFLSHKFYSLSRRQDATGDPRLTLEMQRASTYGMVLFALSLSFAGIDWLMSLEPAWYSTMFGVYIFSGAVISIMAFLCFFFSRMKAAGLADEVTPHHFHDLGKLLFAFTVFWAYISFCQYFLIWYANIPEETIFYLHRQEFGWGVVSVFVALGHFAFPFVLLLSRHAKRFPAALQLGALWVLLMHYVDMYWLVLPNVDHHFHYGLADAGTLLLVAGVMFAVMFRRMLAAPIIPIRDPRLDRSLQFENF